MAGFIYAKQQTSTPTEAAVAGFRPTMAGGGYGIPPPATTQDAHHFAIPEWGVRGWSFGQEDPHPLVRHMHGGGTCASRGLPAQARHKNEEKPALFIPGFSNSGPPSHQVPESQWSSKPTSSQPRPVPVPPAVGSIKEALQHQKDELKAKARQKVASLFRGN